ncbi:MAG: class I SAM-dependent methyltransferase [Cyanobacteriota bacterium]
MPPLPVIKLNLGCGSRQLEGYVNVDGFAGCHPDQVVDLERTPWPFPDNSAEEIVLHHVLEHLGQQPKVFLAVMQELYRVAAADALIHIDVPHPLHDDFRTDPTHVRSITPRTLSMFSRRNCEEWQRLGYANTPLALMTGVDFEIESVRYDLDPDTRARLASAGVQLPDDDLVAYSDLLPNLFKAIAITLRVCKPAAP